MKKLKSTAAGAIAIALIFGGTAFAEADISNTGPGSTNEIDISERCDIDVDNDTDIDVDNNNPQDAESGDGSVSGNTSGGGAQSGNAGNNSSTNIDLNVTNGNILDCNAQQPTTPGNNGGENNNGGGQVSGVKTETPARAQVQAPTGGVGAGSGGLSTVVLSVSMLSGIVGLYRLRKLMGDEA
jgi:hypothetical protein